jgi:hypothetical protein
MSDVLSKTAYPEQVIRQSRLFDICWEHHLLGHVEERDPVRV